MCIKSKVAILGKSYSPKFELLSEFLKMSFYNDSLLKVYTDNPQKQDEVGYEFISTEKLYKMFRYEKIRNIYTIDGFNYGIRYKQIRYAKIAVVTVDMLQDNEEFKDYAIIYVDTEEEVHKNRIKKIKNVAEKRSLEEMMIQEEKLYTFSDRNKYDIIIKKNVILDKINLRNVVLYIQMMLRK